ncbi:hypothetical protein DPEC_G00105860 [Dallia pectoralis]|uniref:Uncharacterized protein n=1 Tax=Dallia pectoralis TaxID=75939 RepID=A0ACC2GXR3_DALPE|nr:hypothetical protein DPEC_G00105860 [Dallia pectoralis]
MYTGRELSQSLKKKKLQPEEFRRKPALMTMLPSLLLFSLVFTLGDTGGGWRHESEGEMFPDYQQKDVRKDWPYQEGPHQQKNVRKEWLPQEVSHYQKVIRKEQPPLQEVRNYQKVVPSKQEVTNYQKVVRKEQPQQQVSNYQKVQREGWPDQEVPQSGRGHHGQTGHHRGHHRGDHRGDRYKADKEIFRILVENMPQEHQAEWFQAEKEAMQSLKDMLPQDVWNEWRELLALVPDQELGNRNEDRLDVEREFFRILIANMAPDHLKQWFQAEKEVILNTPRDGWSIWHEQEAPIDVVRPNRVVPSYPKVGRTETPKQDVSHHPKGYKDDDQLDVNKEIIQIIIENMPLEHQLEWFQAEKEAVEMMAHLLPPDVWELWTDLLMLVPSQPKGHRNENRLEVQRELFLILIANLPPDHLRKLIQTEKEVIMNMGILTSPGYKRPGSDRPHGSDHRESSPLLPGPDRTHISQPRPGYEHPDNSPPRHGSAPGYHYVPRPGSDRVESSPLLPGPDRTHISQPRPGREQTHISQPRPGREQTHISQPRPGYEHPANSPLRHGSAPGYHYVPRPGSDRMESSPLLPGPDNTHTFHPRPGRKPTHISQPRPVYEHPDSSPPRPGPDRTLISYLRPGRDQIQISPPRPGGDQEQISPSRPGRYQIQISPPRPGGDQEQISPSRPGRYQIQSSPPRPGRDEIQISPPRAGRDEIQSSPPRPGRDEIQISPPRPGRNQIQISPPRPGRNQIQISPPRPGRNQIQISPPRPGYDYSDEEQQYFPRDSRSEEQTIMPNQNNHQPSGSTCPDGWHGHANKCYVYVPIRATWSEAERNCWHLGGNLVSVNDHSEYMFLLSVIEKSTKRDQRAWIGATDAVQEGLWLWSDGSRLKYNNWSYGQPSNYKGQEHCMEMNYGADRGQNDAPCWHEFPFLCSS